MVVAGAAAAPKPRTGGRSARVVHDVLHAAVEVFAEVGYDALTFEVVASRAGVNKTTVYRRWPTKAELVRDALATLIDDAPPPDTGSLRDDLQKLVRPAAARSDPARRRSVWRAFLIGANPELSHIVKTIRAKRWPVSVVERAIARGELPSSTDASFVMELVASAVLYRVLNELPVDAAFATRLIDMVIEGARHAGRGRSSG